jgi:hypothetical protein
LVTIKDGSSEIYAIVKFEALREPPLQYATEYLSALQFAADGHACFATVSETGSGGKLSAKPSRDARQIQTVVWIKFTLLAGNL